MQPLGYLHLKKPPFQGYTYILLIFYKRFFIFDRIFQKPSSSWGSPIFSETRIRWFYIKDYPELHRGVPCAKAYGVSYPQLPPPPGPKKRRSGDQEVKLEHGKRCKACNFTSWYQPTLGFSTAGFSIFSCSGTPYDIRNPPTKSPMTSHQYWYYPINIPLFSHQLWYYLIKK